MNNKIKLSRPKYNNLIESIKIAKQSNSIEIEIGIHSKDYVYEPIIQHNLAPRQAKAILDFFGTLCDYGIQPMDIIESILPDYIYKYED